MEKAAVKPKGNLRTCEKGHKYFKTSDCPTCPVCEAKSKPADGFLSILSAPARRALQNNNIETLNQLAQLSEAAVLKFHGMGPGSLPKLRSSLEAEGLSFKH